MIHPYDLREMYIDEAALTLLGKSNKQAQDTLTKRIDAGHYKGIFYKIGDRWVTTPKLIAEGQKNLANSDS